jgi:hypothetical protein
VDNFNQETPCLNACCLKLEQFAGHHEMFPFVHMLVDVGSLATPLYNCNTKLLFVGFLGFH